MKAHSTDQLIAQLTADAQPVARLRAPSVRALGWFGLALPHLFILVLAFSPRSDLAAVAGAPEFAANIGVALLAALLAAAAAFATTVPGYSRARVGALALAPIVWVASVTIGGATAGVVAPETIEGWECLPAVLAFGGLPVVIIGLMLRRGAPLRPVETAALGAIAAAALADVGTRLCHGSDTAGHLIWHMLGAAALILLAGAAGPRVFRWHRK